MHISQSPSKPRVLVAPLDWGLGHATRCIPIINTLITTGADVWLAAEGRTAFLLQTEFPQLPLLHLPGYGIRYGHGRWRTFAALVRQIPHLLRAIKDEEAWLMETVAKHQIKIVISDNRYGLHHPDVYSVLVTHQLQIKTFLRTTDRLLQRQVYRYIQKFNACWVPDVASVPSLAGVLSHPPKMPSVPTTYLGPLSRFDVEPPVLTHYILVLLSGPEPQRSRLEDLVLEQVKLFQTPIFIVRGLPGHTGLPHVPYHVTIVNHLPAALLQKAIAGAQFVVSRSGYSSIMDLMTLQKKCIFIPTPMQTEQEYLARHVMQQHWALHIPQHKFQLKAAISLAQTFPYSFLQLKKTDALQQAVAQLVQQA